MSVELMERKTERLKKASLIRGIESETIVRRAPSGMAGSMDSWLIRSVEESRNETPSMLATPNPRSHAVAGRTYVHVTASAKSPSEIMNVREPDTNPPPTRGESRAITVQGDIRCNGREKAASHRARPITIPRAFGSVIVPEIRLRDVQKMVWVENENAPQ
jgi:hypothetical protein